MTLSPELRDLVDEEIAKNGGGGGGFTPVFCQLIAGPIVVHDAGGHDALWSQLQDNPWDGTPLDAIPDGLGLAFSFNGSDNTITTTEAGVWAFSYFTGGVTDATWKGVLSDGLNLSEAILDVAGNVNAPSVVYPLPSGAELTPKVTTTTPATTGGYALQAVGVVIVRLA